MSSDFMKRFINYLCKQDHKMYKLQVGCKLVASETLPDDEEKEKENEID